jgi:hypothetical protein
MVRVLMYRIIQQRFVAEDDLVEESGECDGDLSPNHEEIELESEA